MRPQQPQLRRGTPVLVRHPARICDNQKHEQDRDDREKYPQREFPRSGFVAKFDRTLGRHPRLDRQFMKMTHRPWCPHRLRLVHMTAASPPPDTSFATTDLYAPT